MAESQTSEPRRPSAVAAILLAAGSSQRFGPKNKLLAEVEGRPLIFWAAARLARSRVRDVIVVTGPERSNIEQALSDFQVRFVYNPDHQAGMGRSIAVGIGSLDAEAHGVLICPGDMPEVSAELIDKLIEAFERNGAQNIVYPALADGSQRNPVVWPRRLFSRLAALDGPAGGKPLLTEFKTESVAVPVSDSRDFLDIDTAEDLIRFRQHPRRPHGS